MGIPGLWEVVKPALQKLPSLEQWAFKEGFVKNLRGHHCMVLGIDASIWIRQSQQVFHKPSHSQMGRNPELRVLFYKLAWLLQACVVPVFILDGPARPAVKRGHQVRSTVHWMTATFRSMIAAFGFYSHEAPGEAEAELAYFNKIGVIDAVVTDDSDAFMFGATCIIRNSSFSRKSHAMEIYTLDTGIHPQLKQEDIVLLAILVGGDYDPTGLHGCGPTIAQRLARSGLGRDLYNAAVTLSDEALKRFLVRWCDQLQHELLNDPHNLLGHQYKQLASQVPNEFPSLNVLKLYVNPTTSGSLGHCLEDTFASWMPSCPDLSGLADLCQLLFAWGTEADIGTKFEKNLWPGAILRSLLQGSDVMLAMSMHINDSIVRDPPPPSSAIVKIVKSRTGTGPMSGIRLLQVQAATHAVHQALVSVTSKACTEGAHSAVVQQGMTFRRQWLPELVVRRALPHMVAAYEGSTSRKQRQREREGLGHLVGGPSSQRAHCSIPISCERACQWRQRRLSANEMEVIDLTLMD